VRASAGKGSANACRRVIHLGYPLSLKAVESVFGKLQTNWRLR
jgi:hypothetical protein